MMSEMRTQRRFFFLGVSISEIAISRSPPMRGIAQVKLLEIVFPHMSDLRAAGGGEVYVLFIAMCIYVSAFAARGSRRKN